MQTRILIEPGRTQLVLSPENTHDKAVLKVLENLPNTHWIEFIQTYDGYSRIANREEDLAIVFDMAKGSMA